MAEPKAEPKVTINALLTQLSKAVSEAIIQVDSIDRDDINTLLKAFRLMGDHIDTIDDIHKVYKSLHNKLSTEVIPKTLEAHGFDSVKSGGYNFIVTSKLRANIPEPLREKGYEWLREQDLGGLIKEQVNANSLTSAIKDYIERTGATPPEDAISVYNQVYTQVRSVR